LATEDALNKAAEAKALS
jgi:hypothetical protein